MMTIPYATIRDRWKEDADFRREHAALEPEFTLARKLMKSRAKVGMSQSEVAARMGMRQSTVARLESERNPQ